MPAESYDDDEDEQEGPKSSFGTYLAEGDALFKQSEFKKALESYSLALELEPEDKNCLVARSKCYLKLGDPQKALQDAEAALMEDKEFNRGLYRKAEALYCMGDFEYALMYYHRGHNLRPELDEFRLGIQKAQEAIDNSIGSAAKVKLENKGDLSFFNRQDDIGNKKRGYTKPTRNLKLKPVIVNRNKEAKPPAPSKKTVKQLLGELYADKEYMEKLMEDEGFIQSHSNKPVYDLVQSGLAYLDTRTEFWRQQRPLYARKKDTGKPAPKKKKGVKQSIGKQVLKQLEEIDQALANGDPERSLKLAQILMKTVEDADPASLPNKGDIIANVHSCIGNAFVEMENLNKALKHHQKDLEMSKKSKSQEGISRGLDNVGRVYARLGDYDKAVRSWNEKLPMVKTSLETTWIYHEIGRCYLELNKYLKAKDCGVKSLKAAEEFDDEVWQLNASVLLAQAQVKLGNLEEGLDKFDSARTIAVSLDDEAAQSAIDKAITDLKAKMDDSQGTTTMTDQETTSDNDVTEDDDRLKVTDDSETEVKSEDEGDDETSEEEEKKNFTSDSEAEKKEVMSASDAEKSTEEETDENKYGDDYEDDTKTDEEDETTKSDKESDTHSQTGDDTQTDSLVSPRDKTDSETETEDKTTTALSDTEEDTTTQKASDVTSSNQEDGTQNIDVISSEKTETETSVTETITENDSKKGDEEKANTDEDDTLKDVTPQNSDTEADEKFKDESRVEKVPSPTQDVGEKETTGNENERSASSVHENSDNVDSTTDKDEKSASPPQDLANAHEDEKSISPVNDIIENDIAIKDVKDSASPVQDTERPDESTNENRNESPTGDKAKDSAQNKSPSPDLTDQHSTEQQRGDNKVSTKVDANETGENVTDVDGSGVKSEKDYNNEAGSKEKKKTADDDKPKDDKSKDNTKDEKIDSSVEDETDMIGEGQSDLDKTGDDDNQDDKRKDTVAMKTSEIMYDGAIGGDKENDPAINNGVINDKTDADQDVIDNKQEAVTNDETNKDVTGVEGSVEGGTNVPATVEDDNFTTVENKEKKSENENGNEVINSVDASESSNDSDKGKTDDKDLGKSNDA